MEFLIYILAFSFAQELETKLRDGETSEFHSEAAFGAKRFYSFFVDEYMGSDLVFSLSVFSDSLDPDLYIKVNGQPSIEDYDFSSYSFGSRTVVISSYEVRPYSNYRIMVLCHSVCHYGLTASYVNEKVLTEGTPMNGHLDKGRESIYSFVPGVMKGDVLTVTLSATSGQARLFVTVRDISYPSHSDDYLHVERTFDGKSVYRTYFWNEQMCFRIAVLADETTDYTVLAKSSKFEATLLRTSVPTSGEVSASELEFYYFKVLKPDDTVLISLTILAGDADIFVKAGQLAVPNNYDFSSIHYGSENLAITADDRKRIGKPTGNYYIGVFGVSHAAYSLVVTCSNSSVIQLKPGFPQSGSVKSLSFMYFELLFPDSSANISIILSTTFGDPDLFVRECTTESFKCRIEEKDLNSSEILASRHSTGSEAIEIKQNTSACSGKKKNSCKYMIGVFGVSDYSIFTVTAVTNNREEIILSDGKPLTLTLPAFSSQLLKFAVFIETASRVEFLLTPLYGNPDLYGSLNSFVGLTDFDKFSSRNGFEIDSIFWTKGVDADSLRGIYHIMVATSEASSFSIVAKTAVPSLNSSLQIYPGHPQKDTLYNSFQQNFRLYSFQVHYPQSEKPVITITLTPITGTFELYVGNQLTNLDRDKETFTYNWNATHQNHSDLTSTLVIQPTDPAYLNNSTYLILVLGNTYLEDNSSTYVISCTAGDSLLTLSADTPHTGAVAMNEYAYFLFPVNYFHEDLTVSLTALSGDADLFISLTANVTRPSNKIYDFKSATFGDEKVTITWEGGVKSHCLDLLKDYKTGDKVNCNVYISVFGFMASTFVLTVRPSTGLPAFLPVSQPLHNFLAANEYQFFYTFIAASRGFKLSLQVESGDPDLYVNVIDRNKSGSDMEKWIRPNTADHDYSSQASSNNEEITESSDILKKKCPSGNCLVSVSVFCNILDCGYYIQAGGLNDIQVLVENQPTNGVSNGSFVYFSYYSNKNESDFSVMVTLINHCNPDLYISKGKNKRPDLANYDWASSNWGGDSILITKDDPYFKNHMNSSMKGTYVIGVIDESQSCSFSIIVNNHPTPIIKIVPGLPQAGNLTRDSVSYYSFANTISKDIIINLTPTLGSGSIYVAAYLNERDIYQSLPGPDRFNWSSDISKERYRLNISASDNKFCVDCSYIIAVKSRNSSQFVYSLTVQNSLQSVILQNGVPVKTESNALKSNIFRFEVREKVDFDISITTYTGHPRLYVTTSKDLKIEKYEWTKYYLHSTDNLKISASEANFKIGTFYIIIESFESCIYSIVAHTKNSPILLVDGWPISYSQSAETPTNVHFKYLALSGLMVFCSVKVFSLNTPTVYTRFQPLTGPVEIPSEKFHDFVYRSDSFIRTPGSGQNSSQLYINLPHSDDQRLLSIGINTYNNSSSDVLFQVHCSSSTQSTILRLGISNIEMLDEDVRSNRYELATPTKGQLSAYVIPCVGEFRLEISNNWTQITNEGPDFISSSLSDGVLLGSVNNAQGYYFVTVSGKKNTSSFQLYEMLALFTPLGETLPKLARPGDNGIIRWETRDENRLNVFWKPAEDEDGNDQNYNVTYVVVFANSSSYLISTCSIHFYQNRKAVQILGSTNSTSLEVMVADSKGFINVLAYLPNESKSPIKQIVYDPTEIVFGKIPERESNFLIWMLLSLLIGTVIAAVYIRKQKIRNQSILNYEMSDIRDLGSVRSHSNSYEPVQNISS